MEYVELVTVLDPCPSSTHPSLLGVPGSPSSPGPLFCPTCSRIYTLYETHQKVTQTFSDVFGMAMGGGNNDFSYGGGGGFFIFFL